jgi:hypothetical protein
LVRINVCGLSGSVVGENVYRIYVNKEGRRARQVAP